MLRLQKGVVLTLQKGVVYTCYVVREGGKKEHFSIRLNTLHKECLLGSPAGQDGGYDGASLAPLHCQIEPGRNIR